MSNQVYEIDFPSPIQEKKEISYRNYSNSSFNTYIAAFSALMYIIVIGLAASYTAPASIDMQRYGSRFYGITLTEITWIASLPTITSGFGNILSGYLSHNFGRKAVIMCVSTPYLLSWLMVVYAPTLSWIYCGRLLVGFCYGMCSVAIPAYIVEIATVKNRGIITAGYNLAFVIGVFFMVCMGFGLRWSWMAMVGAILLTLSACFMYFMPESPQWLIRDGREREALRSLKFLRGKNSDFKKEFQNLCQNQQQQTNSKISMASFKSPTLYKPTFIAVGLFFFQQFSGINVLNSYTVEIFKNSGGNIDPQLSAVIFSFAQVVATVFSTALIDNLGRRKLFISSGGLMTVSLLSLGIYNLLLKHGFNLNNLQWIPLVGLIIYISAFSFGFGPVAIVMPPEIVPIHFRSAVLAIGIVSSSIFGFMVTKSFDMLVLSLEYYGLFWTYSLFTFFGTLFGVFCLPETKGRTVEEINNSFLS